jgi:solute carrier family 27 (fatty acid transporter), member 1/4
LPIYHSNAGFIGIGASLISGATSVIKQKFSASNFWKDCIRHRCTAFSYVGEVCRYLYNQPESHLDKKHRVKVCIGNGMRPNIHQKFCERFNMKCIEIYGATEGNCILMNTENKYGACGYEHFINRIFKIMPYYIIKIDSDQKPIRDKNGHFICCEDGENGLMISMINNKQTKTQFNGYANTPNETNKKILVDVFKTGQKAFNTGDILMRDKYGWIYFIDRVGDTFRWRGENCSTIEVENIISSNLNGLEVSVYGVQVPGQEGRAGMATITSVDVDMDELGEHLKKDLTNYARPIFIRLNKAIEHTCKFDETFLKI